MSLHTRFSRPVVAVVPSTAAALWPQTSVSQCTERSEPDARHTESSNTLYSTPQQLRYNWLLTASQTVQSARQTYTVPHSGQCLCEINISRRPRCAQTQAKEPTERPVFPRPSCRILPRSSIHRRVQGRLVHSTREIAHKHTATR